MIRSLPLTPESDEYSVSHNNITPGSNIKVVRTEVMIAKEALDY